MQYSDALLDITDEEIVLKRYYFPFGDKRVAFADIERIETEEPTWRNGKWRVWGTGTLKTWFPLDWRRPSRDRLFFIDLSTSPFRIGFTAEDSRCVLAILKEKGAAS